MSKKPMPWGDESIAPNGRPVKDNFAEWFGESKVVGAEGEPLVVCHGTASDIEVFDISRFGQTDDGFMGVGFYFTSDADDASQYSYMASDRIFDNSNMPFVDEFHLERLPQGARVMPVYLSIKNPYRMRLSEQDPEEPTAWTQDLIRRGFDGVVNNSGNEWVAFYPAQIKSVIGNNGNYDRRSPSLTDHPVGDEIEQWPLRERCL